MQIALDSFGKRRKKKPSETRILTQRAICTHKLWAHRFELNIHTKIKEKQHR